MYELVRDTYFAKDGPELTLERLGNLFYMGCFLIRGKRPCSGTKILGLVLDKVCPERKSQIIKFASEKPMKLLDLIEDDPDLRVLFLNRTRLSRFNKRQC